MKDSGKTAPICRAISSLILGWMPVALPFLALATLTASEPSSFNYWALGLSLGTSFFFLAFFFLTLRALNTPLIYILSFPLGFTLHAALTINSMKKLLQGKRLWKGRIYG
jgi:hypothetical protein